MTTDSRGGTWRARAWAVLRVLNVRLRFILLMAVTGLLAANAENLGARWERWRGREAAGVEPGAAAAAIEFYCPMHPSVIRAESGNCPICGMPLAQRRRGEREELPEGVLARVELTPERMRLGGIATTEVGFVSLRERLRAAGTIEVDERRTASIAARVPGRIERLHVNFTGDRVERGDPLVDLYSPELVATQQEYLLAARHLANLAAETPAAAREQARALAGAARDRLLLWGLAAEDIAALERDGEPRLVMTLRSPLSGVVLRKQATLGDYVMEGAELFAVADLSTVWVLAFVPEQQAGRVRVGQRVEVGGSGRADSGFHGEVAFIAPVLDPATRSVRVRMDVENPRLALRPGEFVEARIAVGEPSAPRDAARSAPEVRYQCPMHPEVVSDRPGSCPQCGMFLERVEAAPAGAVLAVPEGAVLATGTRRIVYLEREAGTFDAVEVRLGEPSGGWYPVMEGLAAGDRVVSQGAFLVDAEARLNPAAAGAYFGASGGP